MGTRDKDYGDACATARTELMSELARGIPSRLDANQIEWIVEAALAAMHKMPSWSLRSIANATDRNLPET